MEIRPIKRKELYTLIKTASDEETRNLKKFLNASYIKDPYDFFSTYSIVQSSLLNGRALYFGALTYNPDLKKYELWTIVNNNVKEQFTLYKEAKRMVHRWATKYGPIYATMETGNKKNIKWAKKMGFVSVQETERFIVLKLEV